PIPYRLGHRRGPRRRRCLRPRPHGRIRTTNPSYPTLCAAERLTTPNPVTLTQPKHTIKGARGITARSFSLIISPESQPTPELYSPRVTQLEGHSARQLRSKRRRN